MLETTEGAAALRTTRIKRRGSLVTALLMIVSLLTILAVNADPVLAATGEPELVVDLNQTMESNSSPHSMVNIGGTLFFSADDGVTGTELWKSDGTVPGTVLVKDIWPGDFPPADPFFSGPHPSSPFSLVDFGGTLFFSAQDSNGDVELWKSDGTTDGTMRVKDINPGTVGSNPQSLFVFDGSLYFSADDGTNGTELWKSDGTADGTILFKDIYPGDNLCCIGVPGSSNPGEMVDFGGALFFSADGGTTGRELWMSDGTADGTVLVKDIFPGESFGSPASSSPGWLVDFGGTLFFSADDGTNGTELWKSDGTADGTVIVKDIFPGDRPCCMGVANGSRPSMLVDVGGTLFFAAQAEEGNTELWKSDGTAGGTVLVKDIFPGESFGFANGSGPYSLAAFDGHLYFAAQEETHGVELWKSDGTTDGTVLVKDINPADTGCCGPESSNPDSLYDFGGTLYFSANDGTTGQELWRIIGNTAPVANAQTVTTDQDMAVAVTLTGSDADSDSLTYTVLSGPSHGALTGTAPSLTYTPAAGYSGSDSFTFKVNDGTVDSAPATVSITIDPAPASTVGLVDPTQGKWYLRNSAGQVTSFFFGDPGDYPIIGDWDCNGTETPGMYRQSDGFVYLRNSNTQGIADIRFFFGDPGDVPLAGDFNGDGCDTVSIYRPDQGRFFIINKLGANEGGLGAAETDYLFGDPGDKPFVGDFNGNGTETVGLHRETTGLVYFRQSHTQGSADAQFVFGDPEDRLVAGDWGIVDGVDTPAVFRPDGAKFFFRHSNTQGNADASFPFGESGWLPVAGAFGLG